MSTKFPKKKAVTLGNSENKTQEKHKTQEESKTQEKHDPKEIRLKPVDAKKYFDASNDQLNKLRFSDVSLYSSTPTDQATYTAELLLSYYTKENLKTKVLTDATACIGGNAWVFADYVKQVQANELSKLHADMLADNMKTLGKNNVSVTNENYLTNYLDLAQDIVFFDPPWGGTEYKQASEVEIELRDASDNPKKIDEIINGLLSYRCETMLLKLPVNYPIKKILDNTIFVNIDNLVINAIPDGNPLYRLVIMSHLNRIGTPQTKAFPRLGYKLIVPI